MQCDSIDVCTEDPAKSLHNPNIWSFENYPTIRAQVGILADGNAWEGVISLYGQEYGIEPPRIHPASLKYIYNVYSILIILICSVGIVHGSSPDAPIMKLTGRPASAIALPRAIPSPR